MNSNNYRELLEKYYNGDTSVEEERWLRNNGHLLQEQLPLAELSSEKPVMNWSFDEFLTQADQPQTTPRKGMLQKMYLLKYAAAIVVLALLAIALYSIKDKKTPDVIIASNPPAVIKEEKIIKDSGSLVKPVPVINNAIAKSNPVKKHKVSVPVKQPPATQKNDDFFVIVDGRRITDENEALAILQQSLHSLSGNVRETMAGINNSPKLDLKFK